MEKTLKKENLKIAIQKDGRLTEDSLKVLKLMGLELETYGRRLFATCRNFPVEVLFCRDDDIPGYVENGVADIGIVGNNILQEARIEANELFRPGFGYCKLAIAVPKESPIQDISELEGKRIATSFPNSVTDYFAKQNINVKVIEIAGAVEITPALGVADAIVDITATGSTMMLNDLRLLETIGETEAVIITNNQPLPNDKQLLLDQMLTRLAGVTSAKNLKYVMMNAPEETLEELKTVAHGLNSPTVMKLARDGWLAIHAVIDEDEFWEIVPKLKKLGAEGILVLPIEKIVS